MTGKIWWLLLALSALSGCSTPAGRYVSNRLDDLTDVAHVDATVLRIGLLCNVGPLILGRVVCGDAYVPTVSLRAGLGGVQFVRTTGEAGGFIVPTSHYDVSRWSLYAWGDRPASEAGEARPGSSYYGKGPAWGSVGLEVALIVGLGARVDVVECADFLLGLFAVDLVGDDAGPRGDGGGAAPASGG